LSINIPLIRFIRICRAGIITGMEFHNLRRSVDNIHWTYAKTMPQWPHWYIVRSPNNEEIFLALHSAIREHGEWELFYKISRQYLYLGDGYKYWFMDENLEKARIINRAVAA